MSEPFRVRMGVRSYEVDQLGHVNHAVYHQYAEHARLELLRAAGCPLDRLVDARVGIVLLESNIRFLAELLLGDEVDVTCCPSFDARKTFRLDSSVSKVDGTVAAEVDCRVGLIDLDARRLLSAPHERLSTFATDPALLDDGSSRHSAEQNAIEQRLVETVVDSFDDTSDPRLKQVLQSLTRHVHAFIRDVRLTEQEWNTAIEFLTAAGHITDDKRQEFVLLSDVLGASMQTIAVNNEACADATEATVFGPFFVEDAPEIALGGDIAGGAPGQPCWVEGTVTDTGGHPVAGARIEVWECDADGLYDVQHTDGRVAGRARLHSDAHGEYRFWGVTPVPYPIPHDGPVGTLLEVAGRSSMRAAHLHFMVAAEGLRTLVTHIFVDDDPQLDIGDSVFGVKDSLIKRFERKNPGSRAPDGSDLGDRSWAHVRFDIVLASADP